MPDTRPTARLRFKFALLAAVGTAMILLPLGQVLRYQNAEIEALVAERATLDPLTQVVSLQRHLLGHRDVADRVLRGRLPLEEERRLRQSEVDGALWVLRGTLSAGYWTRALNESTHLTVDWRNLARRLTLRQITAPESQDGHQLLVEQAVQIMDLVAATAPPGSYAGMVQTHARAWVAANAVAPARGVALEAALQAHATALAVREDDLRSQRALLGWALASLVALGAWLLVRTQRHPATPPPPPRGDDTRRSRGRRSTDFAGLDTHPQPLLDRLRNSAADTTPAPPPR